MAFYPADTALCYAHIRLPFSSPLHVLSPLLFVCFYLYSFSDWFMYLQTAGLCQCSFLDVLLHIRSVRCIDKHVLHPSCGEWSNGTLEPLDWNEVTLLWPLVGSEVPGGQESTDMASTVSLGPQLVLSPLALLGVSTGQDGVPGLASVVARTVTSGESCWP